MIPGSEIIPYWLKNSGRNIVVAFDAEGIIKETNDLFDHIFTSSKKAPENLNDYFPSWQKPILEKLFSQLYNNDFPLSCVHFTSHDLRGNAYQWEFFPTSIPGNPGTHTIIGVAQQQKIYTPEKIISLINDEHWIDAFINNSPASAWITDEDGYMLMMNSVGLEIVGLANEYHGKTLWDIYPKDMADTYFQNNLKVIETNEVLSTEENFIDKYGRTRTSVVYKFPLKTNGLKKLIGGWSIDITDKKIAEKKIFDHNLKLKELAFLQSHEVRRPLTNILGLVELINPALDEKNDEQNIKLLQFLKQSAIELDDMIRKTMDKLLED